MTATFSFHKIILETRAKDNIKKPAVKPAEESESLKCEKIAHEAGHT